MFQKTYEIKPAPPKPDVQTYIETSRAEWAKILAHSPDERTIQEFLERNPMFLPGARTPSVKSGHYPLHCAAISQPRLPGLRTKVPDFMWISKHSLVWYPTLVEIEKPSKKLFTKRGLPRADFTQARNQLAEWRVWFAKPENIQKFIVSYGIDDHFRLGRRMQLHMVLVYGRRKEFEESRALAHLRSSQMVGPDEELISFDRLAPDPELPDAITVRATNDGEFEAVAIPPLFEHTPGLSDRLISINGVEVALKKTPLISEERRNFLISRVPYWKNWAKNGPRGVINSADRE
jgi:antiviral defense system Shedu protein SduA